uniref:Uncharacterized protein n=1 Tax=Siphoviridae sp. ctnR15 TaxID=2827938 RepID=A0A8S5T1G8_9CAUD|nr:MAG TPA: hypothetical protein [Siphoviridae sp. ctnR15]
MRNFWYVSPSSLMGTAAGPSSKPARSLRSLRRLRIRIGCCYLDRL